CQQHNGYPATF
nr:immunoglobulin light chain junction region [Macaca mulatta]MOV84791.1 immunoglobulin light chain junction region [Macaca mulatta]